MAIQSELNKIKVDIDKIKAKNANKKIIISTWADLTEWDALGCPEGYEFSKWIHDLAKKCAKEEP